MKRSLLVTLILGNLLTVSAFARSPIPTIDLEKTEKNIESVVEMKSYYKGAVRIFAHDNEEPAARPMEITIVAPDGEQDGGFIGQKTLSAGSFCSASLKNSESTYNEKQGLTVSIPVLRYDFETGHCNIKDILNINVRMEVKSQSSVVAWSKSGSH